jgi:tetratricopeptide (TPR) repeat protein
MDRRIVMLCGTGLLALALGSGAAWWSGGSADGETMADELPVPPFPPRIAQGDTYEHCLALLADDPGGAMLEAERWRAGGGGDGAVHCQALAQIATGRPDTGATLLEQLGQTSGAPDLARASILAQAVQARLMLNQPEQAYDDASAALALAPDDVDLLINRAAAAGDVGRLDAAAADLGRALTLDARRTDALVLRARIWRRTNRLDQAERDIDQAMALNADDPEALLERGILRQRHGDTAGARTDWQRAQILDPSSTAADLALQNLALLDAGPRQP